MEIKRVVVGYLSTNCYILKQDENILIVDPGDEAGKIINEINGNVVGILITHSHDDHIGAVNDLVNKYKCKVYNYNNLQNGINIINNFKFEVIYTPGHMNDLVTYYFEKDKVMFVGDFIFKDSIGRVDMDGASPVDMKKSIDIILKYPKDIVIYPGHGPSTTLMEEYDNLIYFKNML